MDDKTTAQQPAIDADCTVYDAASSTSVVLQMLPTPGRRRRLNLHNIEAIEREMANVYRRMDAGKLESSEATKRTYVLKELAALKTTRTFETRIESLEERRLKDELSALGCLTSQLKSGAMQ